MYVSDDLSIRNCVVDELNAQPGSRERGRVEKQQERAGYAENDEIDESQKSKKRKRAHKSLGRRDLECEKISPIQPIHEPLVELLD